MGGATEIKYKISHGELEQTVSSDDSASSGAEIVHQASLQRQGHSALI